MRHFRIAVTQGAPLRVSVEPCANCVGGYGGGGPQIFLLGPAPPVVITASQTGLGGTTPVMAYDAKTNTFFRSSYDNWQWLRVDFGEVVEITKVRRYMSRDGTNITGNRGAQGEQIWTQGRTTDPRVVLPAAQTTGWSAYNNYNPNAWHSVVYGWSAWLNFNAPKRARYFEFNWDGNADALNEVEITYTRFDNTPPTVVSTPPFSARVGVQLSYQVQVTDPNPGESFVYSLSLNPSGATISPTGLFTWTPQAQHAGGPHRFTVRVADSWEGITEQSFEVGVAYVEPSVYQDLSAQGFAGVWIEPMPVFPTSASLGFPRLLAWSKAEEDSLYSLLLGSLTQVSGISSVRFYTTANVVSAKLTNAGLTAILENRWVGKVHSIGFDYPLLNLSVPYVGATSAHSTIGTGLGGSVAVFDSGVMSSHDFFTGRVLQGACFSSDTASASPCPNGSVLVGAGEPCTFDRCYHGTHVAGIAAGAQGVAPGAALFTGVAPQANIVPLMGMSQFSHNCKDGASICSGFGRDAQLAGLEHAIRVRTEQNIKVFNMSIGLGAHRPLPAGPACPTELLDMALPLARRSGIAVVAAAGNDASESGYAGGISTPACKPTVISVGATDRNSDSFYSGSQYGDDLDLLAPGAGILSAWPGGAGNLYDNLWGTSMAAPHVSGALALLATHYPGYEAANYEDALKYMGLPVLDARAGRSFPRLRFTSPVTSPIQDINRPLGVQVDGIPNTTFTRLSFSDDSAVEDRFELAAKLNGILQVNAAPPVSANNEVDARTTGLIDGLSPGTAYQGFVRACKGLVCSAWSNGVDFTTRALAPPSGPADYFRIDTITGTSFRAVWRKSTGTGISHFRLVIRGPQLDQTLVIPYATTEQTFTRSGLFTDRQYSVYLLICNAGPMGAPTDLVCSDGQFLPVHTGATVGTNVGETPPVITSVVRASNHDWVVNWSYSPSPSLPAPIAYTLEHTVPTAGGLTWNPTQVSIAVNTVQVTLPAAPPSIAFRIKACRASGCTDFSNVARP